MLSFTPANAEAGPSNAKLPSVRAKFVDRFSPLNVTDTTDLAGLVQSHKHALANPPPIKKPTAAEKSIRTKHVKFLTTCFNTLACKHERDWYFDCYPRQIRRVLGYTSNDPLHPDLDAYHTKRGAGHNVSEETEDTEETEEAEDTEAEVSKLIKDNAKSAMKAAKEALKEINNRHVAPFDPEELEAPILTDLDAMFSKGNLEKGATLGVMRLDPDPKRVVLGSFNKNGSIMRRPIDFDITGAKIQKQPGSLYPQTRGSTIKRGDIEYCGDWTNALAEEGGEEEMIFHKMSLRGWTTGWGYRDYNHMAHSKQWREQLDESHKCLRHGTEGGAYGPAEIFKRQKITGANAINYAVNTYRGIAPIMSSLTIARRTAEASRHLSEVEQLDAANAYMVVLNQVLDNAVVVWGKVNEDSASWKLPE